MSDPKVSRDYGRGVIGLSRLPKTTPGPLGCNDAFDDSGDDSSFFGRIASWFKESVIGDFEPGVGGVGGYLDKMRSGEIHNIRSPHGRVLTDAQVGELSAGVYESTKGAVPLAKGVAFIAEQVTGAGEVELLYSGGRLIVRGTKAAIAIARQRAKAYAKKRFLKRAAEESAKVVVKSGRSEWKRRTARMSGEVVSGEGKEIQRLSVQDANAFARDNREAELVNWLYERGLKHFPEGERKKYFRFDEVDIKQIKRVIEKGDNKVLIDIVD